MAGYEREVQRLMRKAGFSVKRNPSGSHVIWGNGLIKVTVPAKIKKLHMANMILKQAGIDYKFGASGGVRR